ncbi:thioredoxin domain-containing protein [Chloroflexota bacterium]
MTDRPRANRLALETSPYLLQHAYNPVEWYPWGQEALDRAQQEDRPILLSIGYSACHWCHVMEGESFENKEIARLMNEHFVNIKVDREERPGLDAIYMDAVQAMTGVGGWPLTVFLTPSGKPFYGGTYFPPDERPGLPSFPKVIRTVALAYKTRRGEIEAAAEQVVTELKRTLEVQHSIDPLTADMLRSAYARTGPVFDHQHGGFGSAPKFPHPMILEFLLRYHHRTGDNDALSMVERTLEAMARGGIYDQLGGGFHRYTVDAGWQIPHFEKMLYDNALLSRLYLHAYQATGKDLYRRIAEETLDYMLRDMRSKAGGFYSSQDADSAGFEGQYYTWTPDEIREALGEGKAALAQRYFGITGGGNFEGANVLSQAVETEELLSEFGMTAEELYAEIAEIRLRLLKKRYDRIPPHRDEKILADWNGLVLGSLAEAAWVLGRDDYLEAAVSNATFLTESLSSDTSLKHCYKDGPGGVGVYLLDYALLCDGLLWLYQASFETRWLGAAIDLANTMVGHFWDEVSGVFHDTGSDHTDLVVRPRSIHDNALPSGSAAAAFVLFRLARLTDNTDYERLAASAIRSMRSLIVRNPLAFGHWLCALDFYLCEPTEVVIVGQPADPATRSLIGVLNQRYLPNHIVAGLRPNDEEEAAHIPLLQNREMVGGKATAYVCRRHVCHPPTTDSDVLQVQIGFEDKEPLLSQTHQQ